MKNRRNYYRILHVQPDAPAEVIQTSYRTLMHRLKMHPDLGGDHWRAALINEAFSTLSNAGKRAAYDKAVKALREWRRSQTRAALATAVASSQSQAEPVSSAGEYRNCQFCGDRYASRIADLPQATCRQCGSPLFPVARHERLTATRRALERLPRRMRVTCSEPSRPDLKIQMITEDVSLGGARVISPSELAPGQILRFKFSFGTAIGVITHVTVDNGGWCTRWCAGVRFLTLQITEDRAVFLSVRG